MGKDLVWSTFFEDNGRYADIINVIGCEGEQVVSKSDLAEVDTRALSKSRDLIRKVALGVSFAIIGIENQDEVDYELPVRIMNYDAVHYKKQVAQIGKKLKAEKKSCRPGEYLYGFGKRSRLFPVVTFVLYAGIEPWDGPKTLHDIVDFRGVPEALKKLVQDYEVKIIDIRRLKDTSSFRTDVKYVFDFIRCAEEWSKLLELVNGNTYYQNMDEEAYDVISKYANLKDDIVDLEKYKRKDGSVDMCKGIRDLVEISKEEGREVGREEGREKGREEGRMRIISNMLSKGMAIEEICELAECDVAEVERIRQGK